MTQSEKTLYLGTLIFPVRDGEVLLAEKMRKIGAGSLNGYGGGVEAGESIRASAVREFREETNGVEIKEEDLEKVGIVHFKNNKEDGSVFVAVIHIFTVRSWKGEFASTDEMQNPKWYRLETLAREKMMLADPYWLPRMLKGEKGIAYAEYGPRQEKLLGEVKFEVVENVPEE